MKSFFKLTFLGLFALGTISIISYRRYMDAYVLFEPVTFVNGNIKTGTASKGLNERITQVLGFYKEDFYIKGNGLYIKRKLKVDNDLILSYTSKAMDNNWLKTH